MMKQTTKWVGLGVFIALSAMMLSCGGGANTSSNNDKSIFLQATVDREGDYIEVEMVKDVSTTTADVEVCAKSFFSNLDPSVSSVNITKYDLKFVRTDSSGTAQLPPRSGPLNISLVVGGCGSFEFPVVSTDEKIYGPLGQEFHANPTSIAEFNCYLTVYGRNLAGQDVKAEAAFNIQLAAYLPYDDLIPSIQTFVYSRNLKVGDDWNATWTGFGLITGGYLTDPFGRTNSLSGFDFPVGTYALNTGYLSNLVEGNPYVDFGTPQLIVGNAFGSVSSNGTMNSGVVRLYPQEAVNTASVSIDEFFADKYNLLVGESTNLSWVIKGAPTRLGMSPTSFSGVPVSFEGKDLAFDSVNIVPASSVNPLLYAFKDSDLSQDSQFLDSPLSVTGGMGVIDPEIKFFSVSHASVPKYNQVAFFWKVTGDYEKIELFPINGVSKDVTGRESFFSPPLNRLGANSFNLIVTGKNGSPIVTSSVTVTVTEEVINLAPVIKILSKEPSETILNGTTGAFTFQVDDPENQDSSWRCHRIAGDLVHYGPTQGQIPTGHGQNTISFTDADGNSQGFFTFELTAYDDDNYGFSNLTQKSVELVTFNTSDQAVPNGPEIKDVAFTPGNAGSTGLLPGQDGAISFQVIDPADNRMYWTVEIIAGDKGGTLNDDVNWTDGTLNHGGGFVTVHYQDDPDSTDDAVVFKISASQLDVTDPLTVVAILKVDYLTTGTDVLDFAHIGLYYDVIPPAPADPTDPGLVDPAKKLSFYLNYDGVNTSAAGVFYVDHDSTIAITDLSLVTDIHHGTGDPTKVADLTYERNFISPITDNLNYGELLFNGYFTGPASFEPSALPVTSSTAADISRWYNVFSVASFVNPNTGIYNLPITPGEIRDYQIRIVALDEDNAEESIILSLQIENNNQTP